MADRLFRMVLSVMVAAGAIGVTALQRAPAADMTARAMAAAETFLATLDPAQRAKANLAFNESTRTVWSNLPTGIAMQVGATERNGLKLGVLTPVQEKAALAMVASVLSRDGFQKAMQIVDADQLLETRSAPTRAAGAAIRFGRAEYFVSILGKPSTTDRWMIQFGGHHLAINVTLAGRQSVLTPTHTGAQPATYSVDGKTIRPLGDENDKAFALINALNADQRNQAPIPPAHRNPPAADQHHQAQTHRADGEPSEAQRTGRVYGQGLNGLQATNGTTEGDDASSGRDG